MTGQQLTQKQDPGAVPAWYTLWNQVPWDWASKTQMATADLPREPDGPVRGYVAGRDFRGRETEIPLYAVAESRPTRASGGQLASADARRTATVRMCTDCGANCQLPLQERQGRHLCPMCWRIATVVDFQIELRERRVENAAWARELLAGALAVVWVEVLGAEPTPAGRKRAPLASRVQAVDEKGRRILDVLIRLAGPRTRGAPAEALAPGEGAERMAAALAGRRRVVWGPLMAVRERLAALGHPVVLGQQPPEPSAVWSQYRRSWPDSVADRYAQWRGELDPATGELRTPWPPGTADRLWLCLTRMANAADEGRPGVSRGARREEQQQPRYGVVGACEVRVAVTGPAAAGDRLAELLTAQRVLQPLSVVGPVPSREVPGACVTYMVGGSDVLVGQAVVDNAEES